jgi:hypothetical protein
LASMIRELNSVLNEVWKELLFRKGSKLFALSFWGSAATMTLNVIFMDYIPHDVATYYARLAQEFGAGNWERAFTPAIPPLMTVLAGPLVFLGFPAFTSLKIVTGALFVFGLWPFRKLMQTVLSDHLVSWACLLYAVSPRLIQGSARGMLETSKTFFLLWSVVFLIEYGRNKKNGWIIALSLSTCGLAMGRSEGVLFMPFFLCWIVFFGLNRNGTRSPLSLNPANYRDQRPATTDSIYSGQCSVPGPGHQISATRVFMHSMLFMGVFTVLCLPQLMYIYKITGMPALELRQAYMLGDSLKNIGLVPHETISMKTLNSKISKTVLIPKNATEPNNISSSIRGIKDTLKGLYPFNVTLALVGLFVMAFRKRLGLYDILFMSVIVYNIIIFLFSFQIIQRYISPTVPFLLSWTIIGASFIANSSYFRKNNKLGKILAISLLVALLWNGNEDLISSLFHENIPKQVGLWIGENRRQFIKQDPFIFPALVSHGIYHNGRQPIISAVVPQYSFWADADQGLICRHFIYSYDQLKNHLRAQKADLLIADKEFHETCPEFKSKWQGDTELTEVAFGHENAEVKIYKLNFR